MSESLARTSHDSYKDTSKTERRVSFADFESKSKQLSEDTIINIMNETLEIIPGEKAIFIKHWLDQVPSDSSDVDFTHDPEKVVSFRNQLSDFVINRLMIGSKAGKLDDRTRAFVRMKKQQFLDRVESDKAKVADFIRYVDDPARRGSYSVAEFHGMVLKTNDGKKHDLLAGDGAGLVRSNIIVQREVAGMFVHYSSRAYEKARLKGIKPELSRRIYLNPKFEDSVEIFDQILGVAEDAGIVMKGKIFDRLSDGVDQDARTKGEGEFTLRGDGIVLYAGEDADALLELVEAVYKDRKGSLKGRRVSKVPLKIADGIAIGDEPENGSLTSHRAELLERVKAETEKRTKSGSSRDQIVSIFKQVYEKTALAENVDPNNIAFNLHKKTA